MIKTMLQIKKTMILELPVISLKTKIPSNPLIRSPHWFIGPATANPIAGIAKICMILPMFHMIPATTPGQSSAHFLGNRGGAALVSNKAK